MSKRATKSVHLEIKSVSEDGTFIGYGSVFDVVDSYGDIVTKGAFKRTLEARKNKIRFLWQHDASKPVGKFVSADEDETGLKLVGKFNLDTQIGRDAYAHVRHGDIDGLSIGFFTVKSDDDATTGVRYIREVKLLETSLVTFPANEAATILAIKSSASETSVESAFETLTHQQRMEVLTFIRALLNTTDSPSLRSEVDPPAKGIATPKSDALDEDEPDEATASDPPATDDEEDESEETSKDSDEDIDDEDEELKHSLQMFSRSLRAR